VEDLLREYGKRKKEIRARLKSFKSIKENDYFYELCFCILTPQTSAIRGDQGVKALKKMKFHEKKIDPAPLLRKLVRFHNNKAISLNEAKQKYGIILDNVKKSDKGLRDWLVENVRGYGFKEASHFLRNIGKENLAILDRHILKNLVKYKVINELPKTLTRKKYMEIEDKFRNFGERVNIPMDELDLLFWSMETGEVFK
jgi:N-glycosylase/DNA lyase